MTVLSTYNVNKKSRNIWLPSICSLLIPKSFIRACSFSPIPLVKYIKNQKWNVESLHTTQISWYIYRYFKIVVLSQPIQSVHWKSISNPIGSYSRTSLTRGPRDFRFASSYPWIRVNRGFIRLTYKGWDFKLTSS